MSRADTLTDRLSAAERDRGHAAVPIKDAASLLLLDRAGPEPSLLMGRRSRAHVFMPGAFVFPGGRVDPGDLTAEVAAPLPRALATQLASAPREDADPAPPNALAVAALRETFEETGMLLGRPGVPKKVPTGQALAAFASRSIALDLAALAFLARAITPPGRPRRYDTRFFLAERSAVAHYDPSQLDKDPELEEIAFVPLTRARELALPAITLTVIDELVDRLANDPALAPGTAVPFYHFHEERFVRDLL